MSNMSYCRFNNTAMDLGDCLYALTDENEYKISQEEVRHGVRMFNEFLNFCHSVGIIDGFDEEMIQKLFDEHNEEVAAMNKEEC